MRLSLPLLVLRVAANDAYDTASPHHLALVTNSPHRRPYFHLVLPSGLQTFRTIRPRVWSRADNSTTTRSPTSTRTKLRSSPLPACAVTRRPSPFTSYNPRGSC